MTPDLTVVVTNFKRPDFLKRCLESAANAGCDNFVVSSFCPDEKVLEVLRGFSTRPNIRLRTTLSQTDFGVTELWLRGLYYAPTEYVLVLHDDDYLDPAFSEVYRREILPQLNAGVGLASWRGVMDQRDVTGDTPTLVECDYFSGPTRVLGTGALSKVLLDRRAGPVSPVVSIWRRSVAITALKEALQRLSRAECFSRPGMMLGQEVLTYLRHCEKFASWFYVDRVLTYYGAHEGSESGRLQMENKVVSEQIPKTNHARDAFLQLRGYAVKPERRFLLTRSLYESKDPEEQRRNAHATATWSFHEALGEFLNFPVTDDMLLRSSKDVGDVRAVPFLTDLLDYAMSYARPEDVVLLANTDTCITSDGFEKLRHVFSDPSLGATFAYRHNIRGKLSGLRKDAREGHVDGGVDLIALTPKWWADHRPYFPDMLLACEGWDWVMRLLIEESTGRGGIQNLIYHEWHDPVWRERKVRQQNPGQRYNRNLMRNFFLARGQHESVIEVDKHE